MLTNPQFSCKKNDIGGYIPEIWFYNQWHSTTHYWNDKLLSTLLGTSARLYSDFLKYYGAVGPRNWATYFKTEEDCNLFLDILKYLWEQIYENGRSWLDVTWELIYYIESIAQPNQTEQNRTNYYLSKIKTYRNEQSWQGTPLDINYTKLDAKEKNTGYFTVDPFKPGRSKKPTHYTIL